MEVGGTLIWYYKLCKREVWLMGRNITPDQGDANIDIGRFIHETTFKRNDKEILFGNVRFDVLFKNKDKIVIGEIKKTSKYSEASKYQLLYYLRVLKDAGIYAEGQLLYPEEKKREDVKLTEEYERELDDILKDIEHIIECECPEKPTKINLCKNCGYREYCFS